MHTSEYAFETSPVSDGAVMKITALEEYGLRCLLRVAERGPDDPISAREIADQEGLSLPYAQKIMRTLSDGGMVGAQRGAHGGYYLEASSDEISLGDVFRHLGGVLQLEDFCDNHTGQRETCAHADCCTIRPVWSHISKFLVRTLDSVPLSVLTDDEEQSVEEYLDELNQPRAG